MNVKSGKSSYEEQKASGMVKRRGNRNLYAARFWIVLMGIYADSTVGVSAGAILGYDIVRQLDEPFVIMQILQDDDMLGLKSWITAKRLQQDFAYGSAWKLNV